MRFGNKSGQLLPENMLGIFAWLIALLLELMQKKQATRVAMPQNREKK